MAKAWRAGTGIMSWCVIVTFADGHEAILDLSQLAS